MSTPRDRTCHIAVGSPGRLCGLVTSGALLLGTVKAVVLDEADQLLSEGFYADTAWLLQQLPKRKQVLAFSATFTPELLADLEPLMRRPQKVMLCEESVSLLGIRQFYKLVGPDSGSSDAAVNGAQSEPAAAAAQLSVNGLAVNGTSSSAPDGSNAAGEEAAAGRSEAAAEPQLSVAEQQQLLQLKVEVLLQLLSSVSFHQAVVFCNRKPSAEWLSRRLTAAGCPAAYLSSDLPQPDRIAAMEAVRGFKVRVIVSTDVMARGVDFDRVNLVVNVDLPADAATYVHRVGRTGRFGSRGIAVALLSARELGRLQGYLAAVKGGEVAPLPDTIPADLYSFELSSDWERQAYQQLLAAPTGPPPDSPPPVRKKCGQQQQQQQQLLEEGQQAAAAELLGADAFSYDAAALELLDFGDDDAGAAAGGDGAQQQQQQEAGEYDPATAWEAWAAYYRAQGYDYPYDNPYTQQQPQQELQQQHQQPSPVVLTQGAAADGSSAVIFQRAGSSGDEAASSEAGNEEEEDALPADEEEDALPADEEVDDRARLLLSRLQVAEQAAAAPVVPMALQQQPEQPEQQHAAGQPLCLRCWAGAYESWRQEYGAWQQQFAGWCGQLQQHQHQQWQHYSAWCEAYTQQQHVASGASTGVATTTTTAWRHRV